MCNESYGAKIGSALGDFAEKKLRFMAASFLGGGDYTLISNSLIEGGGTVSEDVAITPVGPREVRIRYREYLGDVYTHPSVVGAFYSVTYPINPGQVQTFPWLAPIAQNWEQWKPNGIIFEFKGNASEYSTTYALGSVMMATEYDVRDLGFSNKGQMLRTAYSNSGDPTKRMMHGIECAPRERPQLIYFTRIGNHETIRDIEECDLGEFCIATEGSGAPANTNLGELWVNYDISLYKEEAINGIPNRGPLNFQAVSTTYTNAAPLLGLSTTTATGNWRLTHGGNVLEFPTWGQGIYWFIHVQWWGSAAVAVTMSPVSGSVAPGTNMTVVAGSTGQSPANGETASRASYWGVWYQSGTPSVLAFPAATLPTAAGGAVTVQITQVSDRWLVQH